MNNLKHYLFRLDMFAPHFEFYLRNRETRYSTKLGGLYTICIVVLTITYGSFKLQEWFTQRVRPNVISYLSYDDERIVNMYSLNLAVTDEQRFIEQGPQTAINSNEKLAIVPFLTFRNKGTF
jgi:hypothetical protein